MLSTSPSELLSSSNEVNEEGPSTTENDEVEDTGDGGEVVSTGIVTPWRLTGA